jgi:hypothetical protein
VSPVANGKEVLLAAYHLPVALCFDSGTESYYSSGVMTMVVILVDTSNHLRGVNNVSFHQPGSIK